MPTGLAKGTRIQIRSPSDDAEANMAANRPAKAALGLALTQSLIHNEVMTKNTRPFPIM